jgi:hypothetical protein
MTNIKKLENKFEEYKVLSNKLKSIPLNTIKKLKFNQKVHVDNETREFSVYSISTQMDRAKVELSPAGDYRDNDIFRILELEEDKNIYNKIKEELERMKKEISELEDMITKEIIDVMQSLSIGSIIKYEGKVGEVNFIGKDNKEFVVCFKTEEASANSISNFNILNIEKINNVVNAELPRMEDGGIDYREMAGASVVPKFQA